MGDDSAGALLPERDDDGSSGPEELQQWEDADSSDGDTVRYIHTHRTRACYVLLLQV